MTIEKSMAGSTAEWKLSGWLDTQSAQELEAELNGLSPDTTALVFDCSGLEYISSAGLRQLVAAHKKMNGALTMRHISDEIMGVIKMTGLDKRLKFE
jgi:anti-anti-sigma factor